MGCRLMGVPVTVIDRCFVFSVNMVVVAIVMSVSMFMVQRFMCMRMTVLVSQQDSKREHQNRGSRGLDG